MILGWKLSHEHFDLRAMLRKQVKKKSTSTKKWVTCTLTMVQIQKESKHLNNLFGTKQATKY